MDNLYKNEAKEKQNIDKYRLLHMKYHRILYQARKNYPLRKEVRNDTYYRKASFKKK